MGPCFDHGVRAVSSTWLVRDFSWNLLFLDWCTPPPPLGSGPQTIPCLAHPVATPLAMIDVKVHIHVWPFLQMSIILKFHTKPCESIVFTSLWSFPLCCLAWRRRVVRPSRTTRVIVWAKCKWCGKHTHLAQTGAVPLAFGAHPCVPRTTQHLRKWCMIISTGVCARGNEHQVFSRDVELRLPLHW